MGMEQEQEAGLACGMVKKIICNALHASSYFVLKISLLGFRLFTYFPEKIPA